MVSDCALRFGLGWAGRALGKRHFLQFYPAGLAALNGTSGTVQRPLGGTRPGKRRPDTAAVRRKANMETERPADPLVGRWWSPFWIVESLGGCGAYVGARPVLSFGPSHGL